MGAWEPIIIKLDTRFVGDLYQERGQQGVEGLREVKRMRNRGGKGDTSGALVARRIQNKWRGPCALIGYCFRFMLVLSAAGVWVACGRFPYLKTNGRQWIAHC